MGPRLWSVQPQDKDNEAVWWKLHKFTSLAVLVLSKMELKSTQRTCEAFTWLNSSLLNG
jgi:hypothetical protein